VTTGEEIVAIADAVSPLDAALASRLRALAWRVAERERVLDEIADEGVGTARAAWAARMAVANPPYPFCRTPKQCAGKGYCPKEIACNE